MGGGEPKGREDLDCEWLCQMLCLELPIAKVVMRL